MGEIIHRHKYERSGGKHAEDLVREKAANQRALGCETNCCLRKRVVN